MTIADILKSEEKFKYEMLGRMQSDCKYYLGYGYRSKKYLWAQDEQKQINYMKDLYNSFSEDKKPEWLTMADIKQFESEMITEA